MRSRKQIFDELDEKLEDVRISPENSLAIVIVISYMLEVLLDIRDYAENIYMGMSEE